jgi:hypothetical protein
MAWGDVQVLRGIFLVGGQYILRVRTKRGLLDGDKGQPQVVVGLSEGIIESMGRFLLRRPPFLSELSKRSA